ncbi:MAG: CehA/McbA family metallohydrolase [Myxococcales bacterium]|nr:CehA/McbA family metallohydrolase [Myxococcales bacterium]
MRSSLRFACLLAPLAFALPACGSDSAPPDGSLDASADGARPIPIEYTAEADPAVSTECLPTPPGAAEVRAKHVECEAELLEGSVAMGRVGDFMLENSRFKVIIRAGVDGALLLGTPAGGIIDAAPHGAADVIKEVLPGLEFGIMRPSSITITSAGAGGVARIRAIFELDELQIITSVLPSLRLPPARGVVDYELRAGEDAVRISMHLTTRGDVPFVAGETGLFVLTGGALELWQPGYGQLGEGGGPSGVGEPILVGESPESAIAARILSPTGGQVMNLDSLSVLKGERISALAGEEVVWEARFGVGRTAAEAWNGTRVEGEGDATLLLSGAPGDRVQIDAGAAPLLRTRLDAAGEAELLLPPGDYASMPGFGPHFPVAATPFSLAPEGQSIDVGIAPSGTLSTEVSADLEAGAPVRVLVVGAGGTLARYVAMGPTDRRLPEGSFTVAVSRGVEFDLIQEDITIVDGGRVTITGDLARAIDTSGWVSGDFHLHSERSTDSQHAVADAARIIAAEGLEVVAATDHDYVAGYGPELLAEGLDPWLLVVVGEEASHSTLGHVNGYPLLPQPGATGQGAVSWFDKSLPQIFDELHAMGDPALGGSFVQINHPHAMPSGWFAAIGLDPLTGMATVLPSELGLPAGTDLEDFGFDLIEVFNRSLSDEDELTLQNLLGFWSLGRRFTMVGNSDSHGPRAPAGSPRTFIRVPDDTRGAFTWADVAAGLRAGETSVSAGAFITGELMGPRTVGDTVPVRVRVQVPPWSSVERLRIYAGMNVVIDRPLDPALAPLLLDEVIDVPLDGTDFITLRADGTRDPAPVITITPYALAGPIAIP